MNFTRARKSRAPAVQMASLMDVVFLLLCFFMTTSVYSQWETEVAIALPNAKSATIPRRMPGKIIINLSETGDVSINGQVLSLDQITERLKLVQKHSAGSETDQPIAIPVVIRADKTAAYEKLMGVIDACRAAEVWDFSLATKEDQKKAKN